METMETGLDPPLRCWIISKALNYTNTRRPLKHPVAFKKNELILSFWIVKPSGVARIFVRRGLSYVFTLRHTVAY